MSRKEHWETVYATKTDNEVSWTQPDPCISLMLIKEAAPRGSVIDVGGGTSMLTERLLDAGYAVTVLDISQAALYRAQQRLGARGRQVGLPSGRGGLNRCGDRRKFAGVPVP